MSTYNISSGMYTDTLISGSDTDTITIDSSTLNDFSISSSMLSGSSYHYITNTTGTGPALTFNSSLDSSLKVQGDAEIDGDLKIKGKSILDTISKIEERLLILQPDPAKLEKYEALRKAYEQYKILESLIGKD